MLKTNERELLLREDNQKESKDCVQKLEEVRKYKEKVVNKKIAAEQEMKEIKKQLALLSAEYLKEMDEDRLKEIEKEKLDLRLKLNDLEDLTKTRIGNIIKDKYMKDLQGYEVKAGAEYNIFQLEVNQRRNYYLDLQKQIKNKLMELEIIENSHPFKQIEYKKQQIKNTREQDDGWVSERVGNSIYNTEVLAGVSNEAAKERTKKGKTVTTINIGDE